MVSRIKLQKNTKSTFDVKTYESDVKLHGVSGTAPFTINNQNNSKSTTRTRSVPATVDRGTKSTEIHF